MYNIPVLTNEKPTTKSNHSETTQFVTEEMLCGPITYSSLKFSMDLDNANAIVDS